MKPTEPPKNVMCCWRTSDGKLTYFYPNALCVRLCVSSKDAGDVVKVRLTMDDAGDFWCWHDFEDNEYTMVYDARILLSMCFPYGLKAAEDAGQGVAVRVRAEVLEGEPPA